jgi:hypothetical protein
VGQVISSPTRDVGGGTLILTMADLTHVRARVRVDETDIGKLAPGVPARIQVAAFPGREFRGRVEKSSRKRSWTRTSRCLRCSSTSATRTACCARHERRCRVRRRAT